MPDGSINPTLPSPAPVPSDPLPSPSSVPQPPQPLPVVPAELIAPAPAEPVTPTVGTFAAPGQTFMPGAQTPPSPVSPQPTVPAQSPLTPSDSAPGQSGISNQFPAATAVSPPPKKKKTKLFAAIAIFVVVLLGAGYVFAFYIPNKPQNVYKTGLNRSGQAIDKIINQATEQKALATIKRTNITGSINATASGATYSGNLDVKFDPSKSNGSLTIATTQQDQAEQKLTANFISDLPAGTQYPNIYFQVSGLKSFGLADIIPALADYDGKWISIDADYLKSLGAQAATAQDTEKQQLSAADISELARAATKATTDYVFTADPKKAIFVQKQFVGKETVDGIKAYHYVVGYNKDNSKAYCSALINSVFSTNAYKKLPWVDASTIEDQKKNSIKDCQDSVDTGKDSETLDMWVDAKYKLIHKVRSYDNDKKDSYTDLGQTYTGGDDVTFFVTSHEASTSTDGNITLKLNLKTYDTQATITYKSTDKDSPYDVKITAEAKPYTQDIKTDKPANVIPVKDVLNKLGYDPSMLGLDGSGGDMPTASNANTERQTDIKALHGQIEAYYAQNGKYPTLANVNDANWRAANMKGLDKEALKDPAGSSYTLAAAPAAKVYSYEVTTDDGKACNDTTADCTMYTLTATYDGGGTFTKTNLN